MLMRFTHTHTHTHIGTYTHTHTHTHTNISWEANEERFPIDSDLHGRFVG